MAKQKEDFLEDVAKRRAEKDKSPEEDAKPKTLTVQVDGQAYRVTVAYGDTELGSPLHPGRDSRPPAFPARLSYSAVQFYRSARGRV